MPQASVLKLGQMQVQNLSYENYFFLVLRVRVLGTWKWPIIFFSSASFTP